MKVKVKDAVIALVQREREGKQIDRALLKNVVDIFVHIGMDAYETNLEVFLLQDTTNYYRRKVSSWIKEDSFSVYMIKAAECLMREKERVGYYLHASSEKKLLEIVEHELLISIFTPPNLVYNLVKMLQS